MYTFNFGFDFIFHISFIFTSVLLHEFLQKVGDISPYISPAKAIFPRTLREHVFAAFVCVCVCYVL